MELVSALPRLEARPLCDLRIKTAAIAADEFDLRMLPRGVVRLTGYDQFDA